MIAKRWKTVDPEYKKELEEASRADYMRYQNEMKEWNKKQARDEQRGQQENTFPVAVLKNDLKEVISEQLEATQDVFNIDQGKTFARRDENSPGLSKDKSDQLEDATGDHDFDKAILALITPQEQERNVDDTQVNADPWEDLFCIEPCTSVYTDLASAKPSSGSSNQSYSNYAGCRGEFSLNPTAASLEYSNSNFMNLDASNLQSSAATRPYYLEIKRHLTAMNQTSTVFQRNSNSPPSAFDLNNQPVVDGECYSTSAAANMPSFQSASLSSDSSDIAAADSEYSCTANATMSSFQNSEVASVPMFRRMKSMSNFSPYQEYYRNLNPFSSMRSFATDAATYQTNAADSTTMFRPSGNGFPTGQGFDTYINRRAEYSSNEYPTFEYLQSFFGIEPKDESAEEKPSRRNSYWY
jgi:hypothetical protein